MNETEGMETETWCEENLSAINDVAVMSQRILMIIVNQ